MRVAIQGELGSFSHAAAMQMCAGRDDVVEVVPCAVSADVFDALARERSVDAAVIPIENSLAGSILEHYDLLLHQPVKIIAEHRQRIRHNLIGLRGTTLARIERVFSHPIALAQCRNFLREHPHMQAIPFYDTAGSVKQIVEDGDHHLAAIASTEAAALYGAEIVVPGIEDNPQNYTRFDLLVHEEHAKYSAQANRMSLAFALENKPGTLVKALQLLAELGVDLTKIESRPVPGKPWEYVFYVDLNFSGPQVADAALAALQTQCAMVKELGRYTSPPQQA